MISRVRARLRARAQGDDGFTIIEAVVAMVLLMILSTAVLATTLSTLRLADQVRSRTVATELAAREVATARGLIQDDAAAAEAMLLASAEDEINLTPLDDGSVGDDLSVGGRSFTVRRHVALSAVQGGDSVCASAVDTGITQLVATIEVTVTWDDRGVFAPVVLRERVLLPQGLSTGEGGNALVAVLVQDPTRDAADSLGVSGATVAVQNGSVTIDGTTGDEGCALLLVPGTYADEVFTVSAEKSGYVNTAWESTVSADLGLLTYGGSINRVTLDYALAATVRVHVLTSDGTASASDAEADGEWLTLLSSTAGTAAAGGWVTQLQGSTLEIPAVWPGQYSGYLGDTVPAVLNQVTVARGATVDIWVRPEVGIVPGPSGTPTPEVTEEPVEPEPSPSASAPVQEDGSEETQDPVPSPSPSTSGGTP
jgi:type II secretory pathway pseudopilin PulG